MACKDFGKFLGKIVRWIKVGLFWKSPKMRERAAIKQFNKEEFCIIEFMENYRTYNRVPFVRCETCNKVGIDYNSDDYNWEYRGRHIWSCPDYRDDK